MHLSYILVIVGFYDLHHFIHRILPSFRPFFDQSGVGAKSAAVQTHIGGLDVKVPVEVNYIIVLLGPYVVCQRAHESKGCVFVQIQTFRRTDTLGIEYFLPYFFELRIALII